jgi:molybdopterin-guanine dinucleotide biosynthesis protein A
MKPFDPARHPITAVILAGGMGRRMGGEDKGLIALAGRPMVEYALRALSPQVDTLLISANRNLALYERYGYPVIPDRVGDYFGPLAGMAAALENIDEGLLITAPCDSPLICGDYVSRMCANLLENDAEIAVARDSERLQPVFALISTGLRESLLRFLESGERKIDRWYGRHRCVQVDFSDREAMFLNINRPEDRERMETRLASPD